MERGVNERVQRGTHTALFDFIHAPRQWVFGVGSETTNCRRDHLIHRKRSPFPYEGKDLTPPKMSETYNVGRDTATLAASEALPRCPAGRSPSPGGVGWRGLPLRTNHGADSGFRRTLCLHPRRAKRRAQVCGEVTVKSIGQGKQQSPAPVLAPHPPLTRSPFPS